MCEQLVVEDHVLARLHLHDFQTIQMDLEYGIHELTQDIYAGRIRIGNRRVLLIAIGRADVKKGRHLAGVLEAFINPFSAAV